MSRERIKELRGQVFEVKLPAHRARLPGNESMIIGSAFLPAPAAGRRGTQPTCPWQTRFLSR